MFSRQWILMESEHKISGDGSYTTSLTLQGYIPLAAYPPQPAPTARQAAAASRAGLPAASSGATQING